MKTEILQAFEKATQSRPVQTWIDSYTPPANPNEHQFVLFLKPEATAVHDGVNLGAVLDLVLDHLKDFGVSIHAARALPAAYLDHHAILDQHYGVINRISKLGVEALTDDALNKLNEVFAKELSEGALIMGGHQFLKAQPEISPLALSTMNDNIGTTKLAGGSYAMRLNVLGQTYILLNPFHAYQLVPFTTPGRAILVFECRSTRDWSDLRVKLTGATNPAKAEPGSIRAALRKNKDALGMKEVNQGANGVHLSAGPLEGMVELQRFFTDHDSGKAMAWDETAFGTLLLRKLNRDDVARLAQNPNIEVDGKMVSAFDLTEEINAPQAMERLV
ncbi:MAG: hypothetical protein JJU29_14955 [Verrucomicrobia bacterium]|nr:hypothetical protein [Verrucomicrobiota bacterium]MCH8513286.1 hypothetical protein [Kiritimatiellia bacterium]